MIPKHQRIISGMFVRHDEGLLCQIEDVRRSTNAYEATHRLGGFVVNYTQLEAGNFPIGTKWSKGEKSFRKFFTCLNDAELTIAMESTSAGAAELAPFSLVLGPNFRSSPAYSILRQGDREVRARLEELIGPSSPQMLGRLVNILAEGQIRFKDIPEIEPHPGKGVTFSDPTKLYREWGSRGDVGPGLGGVMRKLIRHAALPNASFQASLDK